MPTGPKPLSAANGDFFFLYPPPVLFTPCGGPVLYLIFLPICSPPCGFSGRVSHLAIPVLHRISPFYPVDPLFFLRSDTPPSHFFLVGEMPAPGLPAVSFFKAPLTLAFGGQTYPRLVPPPRPLRPQNIQTFTVDWLLYGFADSLFFFPRTSFPFVFYLLLFPLLRNPPCVKNPLPLLSFRPPPN